MWQIKKPWNLEPWILCTSISVWFSSVTNLTSEDYGGLSGLLSKWIIGTTLPTLQELYPSRVNKRAGKITLDPSHPAHSLFELLPSGRRYRASEWPDTETVSSLMQSISWTLEIKHGTHNTILHYLFITHTYFSFQICTYQTCTHIIVYTTYCVFAFLYIAYLYIYILFFIICVLVLFLSVCCTVELLSQ